MVKREKRYHGTRRLRLNTLRGARRSMGRFLSLFGIIAIASAFFAGLKVTGRDMKDSAEEYYNETGLMDVRLVSTAGFHEDDLAQIAGLSSVEELYGAYSEAAFLPVGEDSANELVIVHSLPQPGLKAGGEINALTLTEGRLPEKPDECLIEVDTPAAFSVGDSLRITVADEETTLLKETEFTIVGRADWSMYVDFERGTTTIGNGSIDSFLIVPPEAFDSPRYTDVFLTLTETDGVNSFRDDYMDIVERNADALLDQKAELSAPGAKALQDEAREELDNSKAELEEARAEYESGSEELETALAEGRTQLSEAAAQIEESETQLESGQAEYDAGLSEYESGSAELDSRQEQLTSAKEQTDAGLTEIAAQQTALSNLSELLEAYRNGALETALPQTYAAGYAAAARLDTDQFSVSGALDTYLSLPGEAPQKAELYAALTGAVATAAQTLQTNQSTLEATSAQLIASQAQIDAAREQLNAAKAELDSSAATLQEGKTQLAAAKESYETSKTELETREETERAKLAEAKEKLDQGESDIADAEEEIANIPDEIEWYAFDRSDNPGFASYGEDADRIDRIARVFPVFFLLVAALVCLTTMTRMVEEQRTEIGTLKALGFSARTIAAQFLVYAFLASVLGVAVGTAVGYQVFPRVIFICYQMMYHFPFINCPYHMDYALGCLGAALLCTGLTSLAACLSALREEPANSMRPKPPKQGRRILLERVKWLWRRCSFNVKVTIRNFCRYRSRVLMTMLGICGCTALLVTGFGLYHAIAAIVDLQYEDIFVYDVFGLYDEEDAKNRETLSDALAQREDLTGFAFGCFKSGTVQAESNSYEVLMTAPEEPGTFSDFVVMRDRETHTPYTLDDTGVIINEKLASLLDVGVGDTITIADSREPAVVSAIMENYAMNRIMMSPKVYESLFGEYEPNCFFANETAGTDEDALARELLDTGALLRLEFTAESGQNFRNLVQVLGYVVLLIIVFSGLLAFVVLFNLANINILERTRELATLKVLGFYEKEVRAYIFRENILSSFLGMLAGLVVGVFLCRYVVRTAEVDVVMFAKDIPWYCFLFSAAITMLFTAVVNLLLGRKLRNIDMAASMKAIE